ncbi:MAG: hypothetical protein MJ249_05125 [Kiritimatiellae bacterium]|nr:hypothetical protein [Kiritimatiellia bacterium]
MLGRTCVWLLVLGSFLGGLGAQASIVDWSLDISGSWQVTGKGFEAEVTLPGTLADAKLGVKQTPAMWAASTDRRVKGALTRAYLYEGRAVYRRKVTLPWPRQGEMYRTLEVFLERVMWRSEVFWDGYSLGVCDSLATPHVHRIPMTLADRGEHTLEIAVDNSNLYGLSGWSHAYGPVMQSVWHGICGTMEIRSYSPTDRVRIFATYDPNGTNHTVDVEVPQDYVVKASLQLNFADDLFRYTDRTVMLCNPERIRSPYLTGRSLWRYRVDPQYASRVRPWTPDSPNLYLFGSDFNEGYPGFFAVGFRSLATHGRTFLLNGQPFFLRGNVENCHFPLTGAPATDVESWTRIWRKMKEDGFNAIRFHSWCPPEAAFEAADEVGLFLMPEAGIWSDGWNGGAREELPGRCGPVDRFIQEELARILHYYGNHPSFFSLGIGNEFAWGRGGCNWERLNTWMRMKKEIDPRHLYMIASGRGYLPEDGKPGDDFSSCGWVPAPGDSFAHCVFNSGSSFPNGTRNDFEASFAKALIPHVRHEVGQWAVYPLRDELKKYTGVLRPFDREEFVRRMDAAGLSRLERRFHDVSAKMNRVLNKEDVECLLRTPSCAGFQMLSAQDFSGQGEALVGWRDSFYDIKPGFKGMKPFTSILGPVAFLARFDTSCLTEGDVLSVDLQVRNLTSASVPAGTDYVWTFARTNGTVRLAAPLAPNELRTVGRLALPLKGMKGTKASLTFGSNDWPIWVYPKETPQPIPSEITVTADRTVALAALAVGRRVIYTGRTKDCGKGSFRSVFWSAAWFSPSAGAFATMGSCVDAKHPLFRAFTTEDWTDRQWKRLCEASRLHRLDGLPTTYDPIVRGVPDFHHPASVASLFELSYGKGRLVVCGFPLDGTACEEIRFRNALLAYVNDNTAFAPKVEAPAGWLEAHLVQEVKAAIQPPAAFKNARFYIEAQARLEKEDESVAWIRSFDAAYFPSGSYTVKGGGWRDASGAYWHGRKLVVEFQGVVAKHGVLRVRFRDPNECHRTGRGTFEGRPFTVPCHDANADRSVWVEIPVQAEDALDGKMTLVCESLSGPNLMIDRVVFTDK